MTKKDMFYNIGIGVLVIAIMVLIVVKFIAPKNVNADVRIKDHEKITVMDLDGNQISLVDLFDKADTTYFFIFEMNDCFSCISKGLEDLKSLKKAGKPCMGIVVHHMVDEVKGWSANYDFSPFFVIKKPDFYEYIKTPVTPVMVEFKNGKVENYRFFRP
jgi:hypothetical protein